MKILREIHANDIKLTEIWLQSYEILKPVLVFVHHSAIVEPCSIFRVIVLSIEEAAPQMNDRNPTLDEWYLQSTTPKSPEIDWNEYKIMKFKQKLTLPQNNDGWSSCCCSCGRKSSATVERKKPKVFIIVSKSRNINSTNEHLPKAEHEIRRKRERNALYRKEIFCVATVNGRINGQWIAVK